MKKCCLFLLAVAFATISFAGEYGRWSGGGMDRTDPNLYVGSFVDDANWGGEFPDYRLLNLDGGGLPNPSDPKWDWAIIEPSPDAPGRFNGVPHLMKIEKLAGPWDIETNNYSPEVKNLLWRGDQGVALDIPIRLWMDSESSLKVEQTTQVALSNTLTIEGGASIWLMGDTRVEWGAHFVMTNVASVDAREIFIGRDNGSGSEFTFEDGALASTNNASNPIIVGRGGDAYNTGLTFRDATATIERMGGNGAIFHIGDGGGAAHCFADFMDGTTVSINSKSRQNDGGPIIVVGRNGGNYNRLRISNDSHVTLALEGKDPHQENYPANVPSMVLGQSGNSSYNQFIVENFSSYHASGGHPGERDTDIIVGLDWDCDSNSVIVTNNSTLYTEKDFRFGWDGSYNSLLVEDSTLTVGRNFVVGYGGSRYNAAEINRSVVTNGECWVGLYGAEGTLDVTDSHFVVNQGDLVLGWERVENVEGGYFHGDNNTVTFRNSTVEVIRNVVPGNKGANNTLIISNTTMQIGSNPAGDGIYMSYMPTSTDNAFVIQGATSKVNALNLTMNHSATLQFDIPKEGYSQEPVINISERLNLMPGQDKKLVINADKWRQMTGGTLELLRVGQECSPNSTYPLSRRDSLELLVENSILNDLSLTDVLYVSSDGCSIFITEPSRSGTLLIIR